MQDPTTGQPLPADAIQRALFIAAQVHIYQIPPLTSSKGYKASAWTANDNKCHIFTARLRVMETALPTPDGTGTETPRTDILLEDSTTGELFAAAPYTSEAVVEQALDSSRFFAIRVQGEGNRKAMLGVGFEDRSEAFDFGVCLQEVRRIQGLDKSSTASAASKRGGDPPALPKSDLSLKAGETITVKLRGRHDRARNPSEDTPCPADESAALFAIPPPPRFSAGGDGAPPVISPPPQNAREGRAEKRRSRRMEFERKNSSEAGFDDGEFGEFQ